MVDEGHAASLAGRGGVGKATIRFCKVSNTDFSRRCTAYCNLDLPQTILIFYLLRGDFTFKPKMHWLDHDKTQPAHDKALNLSPGQISLRLRGPALVSGRPAPLFPPFPSSEATQSFGSHLMISEVNAGCSGLFSFHLEGGFGLWTEACDRDWIDTEWLEEGCTAGVWH